MAYGKRVAKWIAKGQSLPNATTVDSAPDGTTEAMVKVGHEVGTPMILNVYAKDAWAIADAATVQFTLQKYTSDAHASAVDMYGADNEGSKSVLVTGKSGNSTFPIGTLMAQFVITGDELKDGYDWIQLLIETSADESSHEVDAFISIV